MGFAETLSKFAVQWTKLLLRLAASRRPGFIGNVPYLFCLRLLTVGYTVARLLLPASHWTSNLTWFYVVAPPMVAAAILHFITFRLQRRYPERSVEPQVIVIVLLDLVAFSGLYHATDSPTSDFYLFFYLPLLESAEHLRLRWTFLAAVGAAVGFALAIWAMPNVSLADKLILYGMRVSYLGCFVVVSLVLIGIESIRSQRLQQQQVETERSLAQLSRANQHLEQRQVEMKTVVELFRRLNGEFQESAIIESARSYLQTFAAGRCRIGILQADKSRPLLPGLSPAESEAVHLLSARVGARLFEYTQNQVHDIVLVPIRLHRIHFGNLWAIGPAGALIDRQAEDFWSLAGQIIATNLARARRIEAYREISKLAAEAARDDFEVEKTLRRLVVDYRFEFACISVKDKYSGRVRMVRVRNIPPGWQQRSDYEANDRDILADIVRTGKTEVVPGWDDRFNREIYEKFGHERLVRMYTPIFRDGEPVGVLEVGGPKDRLETLLPPVRQQEVKEEAIRLAELIEGISDSYLLEKIAEKATAILGAGAALIHVFTKDAQGNEHVALQASSGLIAPSIVHALGRDCAGKPLSSAEELICHHDVPFCRVFPLSWDSDRRGHLALLYFQPNPAFSAVDKAVAESYARLVERLISTSDAIKETRTRGKLGWTASSLQCVLQSLVADPESARTVPQQLTALLQGMLDADTIALYEHRGGDRILAPVRHPVRESHLEPAGDSTLALQLLHGQHLFLDLDKLQKRGWRDKGRYADRENIVGCAVLILRPRDTAPPVGVLFANYRTAPQFDDETKSMVESLAQTAAIALRTAQINERNQSALEEWQNEMAALEQVEKVVLTHDGAGDANQILRDILVRAVDVAKARHGIILRWDPVEKKLCHRSDLVIGFSNVFIPEHPLRDGIVGQAAERDEPILISDVNDLSHPDRQFYHGTISDTRSQLAVRLKDRELLGVLSLEHPDPNHFTPAHQSLVQTLALQAAIAFRMVGLTRDVELQRAPLNALTETAARIRDQKLRGKVALRLLLTAVTAGTGLRFNRAAIFRLSGEWLFGEVAVGPMDKPESETIWQGVSESTPIATLLDEALRFGQAVEVGGPDSKLSLWVREKQVQDTVPPDLPDKPADGTACVPISPSDSDEILGYIVADRAFDKPSQPLSETDKLMLAQFSNLAADILRGDRVALLPASDRDWQKHFGDVLHDVAPYFDRAKAALAMPPDPPRAIRHINRGTGELGRIKQMPWKRDPVRQFDLVAALSDLCDFYQEVPIEWQPPQAAVQINGVRARLDNAFIEVIKNAVEQRPVDQGLRVSMQLTVFGEQGRQQATVEIEDNGGGKIADVQPRLFIQGGRSTKDPARGRGSLRIKQIIEEFGGSVECRDGINGIVVSLRLPVAQSARGGEKAKGAGV